MIILSIRYTFDPNKLADFEAYCAGPARTGRTLRPPRRNVRIHGESWRVSRPSAGIFRTAAHDPFATSAANYAVMQKYGGGVAGR